MTNNNDNSPTNPLSPSIVTIPIKFPIISIPNTGKPVSNTHKIDTGTRAIITDTNPPKNPVK